MTATSIIDPALPWAEQIDRAEPDLLRALLKTFVDALMGAEADAICGAPYGSRSEERVNSRNGYRAREWDTPGRHRRARGAQAARGLVLHWTGYRPTATVSSRPGGQRARPDRHGGERRDGKQGGGQCAGQGLDPRVAEPQGRGPPPLCADGGVRPAQRLDSRGRSPDRPVRYRVGGG
jgi:hypothetical protein